MSKIEFYYWWVEINFWRSNVFLEFYIYIFVVLGVEDKYKSIIWILFYKSLVWGMGFKNEENIMYRWF